VRERERERERDEKSEEKLTKAVCTLNINARKVHPDMKKHSKYFSSSEKNQSNLCSLFL